MARLKFNHVFIPLVMLSGLSAFVSPPGAGQAVRGQVDAMFTPVSYPVRQLAGEVSRRFDGSREAEFGQVAINGEAIEENQRLRNQVSSLTMQLEALKTINAAREIRGDAQKYAVPVKVSGGDSSGRQILNLKGGTSMNLAAGQPVVRNDALIGRILSSGAGTASVKLITDPSSHITGQFGHISVAPDGKSEFLRIPGLLPLVDGKGNGKMSATNLPWQDVAKAGVRTGDYVVLWDPEDWPVIVNGFILGKVESIKPMAKAPLYAEIEIKPLTKLSQLTEVMVVQLPETSGSARPARTK